MGILFSRFPRNLSVKFSFRFIYLECYLLRCWLFMVYVFSGRENNIINQHYLPYLLFISMLMPWSGFTSISELKSYCGTHCNFKASLLIRLCAWWVPFFYLVHISHCTYIYADKYTWMLIKYFLALVPHSLIPYLLYKNTFISTATFGNFSLFWCYLE